MHIRTRLSGATIIALLAGSLAAPGAGASPSPEGERSGKMVLVLDASGSMAEPARGDDSRIEAARESLNAVVDTLTPDQAVGMRVFGANDTDQDSPEACTDSESVVDVEAGNADDLRAAIEDYEPVGWTPTSHALREAAKDLGDEGQRTIVLVSDGEPTCDPDPCEVAEELAEDGISLKIDVVGLDVGGDAKSTLQCVANRGNGTYYDADDADSLTGALVRSADRSARPYSAIGTPVEGTPAPEGAPVIRAGDWLDRIGTEPGRPREIFRKHYSVERTEPGSTLSFSATINRPDDETEPEYLVIQAETPDGTRCGRSSQARGTQFNSRVSTGGFVVAAGAGEATECAQASELRVVVQRGFDTSENEHAQIEAPLEIRVVEEPPVDDVESLPEPQEAAEDLPELEIGEATPVIGGSSFAEAPTLEPGTYSGTIVPGETQVFFVDVDWGQQLRTRLAQQELTEEQQDRLGSSFVRTGVQLLTPARLDVALDSVQTSGRRAGDLSLDAPPVVYRHRDVQRDPRLRNGSLAGTHAVVVSVFDQEGDTPGVEIPFTLTAAVEGEVAGDPGYDDPIAAASAATEPETDETESAAPADDEGGTSLLAIVLGALGAMLIAGAVALWTRTRRGGAAPGDIAST